MKPDDSASHSSFKFMFLLLLKTDHLTEITKFKTQPNAYFANCKSHKVDPANHQKSPNGKVNCLKMFILNVTPYLDLKCTALTGGNPSRLKQHLL